MKRSIIVKTIFNIAIAVVFTLFVSNAIFIKIFKSILAKSEIQTELIAKLVEQSIVSLTVVLVVLILIIIAVIYFNLKKLIIKPLEKLYKGVEIIASGNLDYKIRERAEAQPEDEIDQLAQSFDEMAVKLKKSYSILEKKVEERTEDIVQKMKDLDKMKIALYNILEDVKKGRDILESERDKLNTIISSMGEGLFVLDNDLRVVLINDKASQMLEISMEKAIGKNNGEIVSVYKGEQKIPDDDLPAVKMFKTGQIVKIGMEDNFYYLLPSGKKFPITLVDAPLKNGDKIVGAIIIFRDITDEKKLDEARSGFISVASHQLRTPLTSIRWYSEMLLSEDVGALNNSQKDFLNEIHGGAERLYQTVNLLLGISRIESGKIKVDSAPINLIEFTREIAKELSPQIDEKKLTLKISPPDGAQIIVSLDQLTLRQVILNLFSNAIRYTNDNGIIEAGWTLNSVENEIVYFVRDNGIGIPESQRSRIFSKFFRADNALAKVTDGSGLGLALVKDIVLSWKGNVWFETEDGKGTTFFFTIPLGGIAEKK